MSGKRRGAEPTLRITKKKIDYDAADPRKKIRKESKVDATVPKPEETVVKVALRIRQGQVVKEFKITGAQGDIPLTDPPAAEAAAIALELKDVLGQAADEQWVVKYADYKKAQGMKLESTLELDPFGVHPNGLQIVPVVFTHKDRSFAADNYVVGISILPGKNNAGIAFGAAAPGAPGAGPAAKKAKAKPAAKKPAKRARKKR
jgi:hypothetical protein